MHKILVTGASGFIGNYVVQELLKNDFTIIASSSDLDNAKKAAWFSQVEYIPFKLEHFEDSINYQSFFGDPPIMIHLAWQGLPYYKSSFHNEINLPQQVAFLNNLLRNGLKDITVTGTCFEYGMNEGMLSEDMPAEPANPYALAKDELRKTLERLQESYSFSLKWIRLFYMYGKGQNANSLLSQLDKALQNKDSVFNMSGGEQLRDYLQIEKVAENIVKIALQTKVEGIINCCSGQPVSIKQLVEDHLREQQANIKLNLGYYPYPDHEPMNFWGDDKKLKTITDK